MFNEIIHNQAYYNKTYYDKAYYNKASALDIDRLRCDMKNESLGAYFGGGFGGALMESFDVDKATPEKLVEMAQRQGIHLENYLR